MTTYYDRLVAIYQALPPLHYINPQIIAALNTPVEQRRADFFTRTRVFNHITALTVTAGFGSMGWMLGEMLTDKTGLTLENDYAAISVITGASSALFSLLATTGLNYREYLTSPSDQPKSFSDFFNQKWRDVLSLFLVVLIVDSLWLLFYDRLAIPLAVLLQGSSELTFGSLVAAMIIVFGGLTTVVTDILSKLVIGLILCDSATASLQGSFISGVAGGVLFGTISNAAELIGLENSAYIGLTLVSVSVGSAATAVVTTGAYRLYHEAVKSINHQPDVETGELAHLTGDEQEVSVMDEIRYRIGVDCYRKR